MIRWGHGFLVQNGEKDHVGWTSMTSMPLFFRLENGWIWGGEDVRIGRSGMTQRHSTSANPWEVY